MKLTDKQATALVLILSDSLEIKGGPFVVNQEGRLILMNQILAQQDETVKELGQ